MRLQRRFAFARRFLFLILLVFLTQALRRLGALGLCSSVAPGFSPPVGAGSLFFAVPLLKARSPPRRVTRYSAWTTRPVRRTQTRSYETTQGGAAVYRRFSRRGARCAGRGRSSSPATRRAACVFGDRRRAACPARGRPARGRPRIACTSAARPRDRCGPTAPDGRRLRTSASLP